jgi:hypothetical protein
MWNFDRLSHTWHPQIFRELQAGLSPPRLIPITKSSPKFHFSLGEFHAK